MGKRNAFLILSCVAILLLGSCSVVSPDSSGDAADAGNSGTGEVVAGLTSGAGDAADAGNSGTGEAAAGLTSGAGDAADVGNSGTGEAAAGADTQNTGDGRSGIGDFFYSVGYGNDSFCMDQDGVLVEDDGILSETLYDLATGDADYVVYSREVECGTAYEDGYPEFTTESALYDMEGNLICDWQPVLYQGAMGGLVVRSGFPTVEEDADSAAEPESALVNPFTGEVVNAGVDSLARLDEQRYAAFDYYGRLLGTVDQNGKAAAGFPCPVEVYNASCCCGYLVACGYDSVSGEETLFPCYVLDGEMNLLFQGEYESFSTDYFAVHGPYVFGEKDGMAEMIRLGTFEVAASWDMESVQVQYFDGERIVTMEENGQETSYRLCDENWDLVAGPFDWLEYDTAGTQEDTADAGVFLARKGDTFYRLNHDGDVLAQIQITGADYVIPRDDGYYSYYAETGEPDEDGWREERCGILDRDFHLFLPHGDYSEIDRVFNEKNGEAADLWYGYRYMGNGENRIDLFRSDGGIVLSNLTAIGTASENAIAVMRGFSAGLVDFDGNWIVKYSIYQDWKD